MADTPVQCCVGVGNSTCGVADRGGGPHFQKGGPEGVLQLSGDHTAQPPQESLFQGAGKEAPADCRTSTSGGAMWFPSWPWNSEPALYPCRVVGGGHGSLLIQSTCALWTWRRLTTVSLGESWREYGVPGPLVRAIRSCTNKVRAVSAFSAQSQARSQWVLDSAKFAPCHQFCL